jgi:DNA modification methylase
MELKIKEEFKKLIPPLTAEEFKQLETNCIDEGIRDAIVTWQGFIIDGHNRYKIATDWQLSFKTIEKAFDSKYDVIDWMLVNQLGRRNLNETQKSKLRGDRYENEKMRGTTLNQYSAKGQNVPQQTTAERLANEYNVSEKTIKRDAQFSRGLDLISKVAPEKHDEILLEKTDFTKQVVIEEFSKIEKEVEKQLKSEQIFISEDELNAKVEAKAKEKLKELEDQKKNHYSKIAEKIKNNDIKPQSVINIENIVKYDVKLYDIYLINDKHKLIVADSFKDYSFIKENISSIDCVCTDPPYGISYKSPTGNAMTQRGDYNIIEGDNIEFEPQILFEYCSNVITWGGNYYANKMVNSAGWLVWDKRDGKAINLNSDCELAWTNMLNSARLFHHTWNGMIKASEHGEKRIHPTQKPIKLFEWCLEVCKAGENILDLFAGSGIIIPACENTNRIAFAVEKDLSYASSILNRLSEMNYKIQKI